MRSIGLFILVGCGGAQPAPLSSSAPTPSAQAAAVGQLCDDGARTFVVDAHPAGPAVVGDRESTTPLAGTVVAITRADGKRVDAPIDPGSAIVDNCGGTGGGHAGCSMSGGTSIHSRVLGSDTLVFGVAHRNTIVKGESETECRNVEEEQPTFDACATKSWFAIVGGYDSPYIRVFAGTGAEPLLQEPVQQQDRRYAGRRAVLQLRDGSGTLEVDGHAEPCLAVSRPRT